LARLLQEKLETIDPGLGIEDMVLEAPVAERLDAAQLTLRHVRDVVPSPLGERVRVRAEAARSGASDAAAPSRPPPPPPPPGPSPYPRGEGKVSGDDALAALVARLGNRLGLANLCRPAVRESHLPERAVAMLPVLAAEKTATAWPLGAKRPIRLLPTPEPVEA